MSMRRDSFIELNSSDNFGEGSVLDTYFDSGTQKIMISEVKVEREAKTIATVLFPRSFLVF